MKRLIVGSALDLLQPGLSAEQTNARRELWRGQRTVHVR